MPRRPSAVKPGLFSYNRPVAGVLGNLWNIVLILAGFGLLIAVHELGHFLAAKWAGVRVYAFAIGFGQAICSWRQGLGFRWGSSEREYLRLTGRRTIQDPQLRNEEAPSLSPTEYRLNWFPFGGYVKMQGQEDLSPVTASTDPASYSAKPVWKRMIIMSGGVTMNLLLGGVLFVIAYMVGIMEVAPIVGGTAPGSPAEAAGLRAGDRVVAVNGKRAETFNDIRLATAMAGPRDTVRLTVERIGEAETIDFAIAPKRGGDGLLQIGIAPAPSATLIADEQLPDENSRRAFRLQMREAGLGAVQPGMTLVSVDGRIVSESTADMPATAVALQRAIESSEGAAVSAVFRDRSGVQAEAVIAPKAELQVGSVWAETRRIGVRHLAGLTPVMRVLATRERAARAGLMGGDVFARIGSVEWPGVGRGIAEVRAHAGRTIDLEVMRDGVRVALSAPVGKDGQIGFLVADTADEDTLLTWEPLEPVPPWVEMPDGIKAGYVAPPAASLFPGILPGSRVVEVNGEKVRTFRDVREAMKRATGGAMARGEGAAVELVIEPPARGGDADPGRETVSIQLSRTDVRALHSLGWDASAVMACFDVAQFKDAAGDPWHAVVKGVRRTHYVVMMTYVTFLRLFQGTVPVDQLHGPVGITHIGSLVAGRGLIYLIFFLGLISVNLAVINFLPLPIFDGGHMVFLAIEGITRRPVSAAVQNAATLAGLALILTVFVVVTYNDVVRLLG